MLILESVGLKYYRQNSQKAFNIFGKKKNLIMSYSSLALL